ncbi:MAG: tyrosine-type recombinase/integrase [Halorhodospira sp.]
MPRVKLTQRAIERAKIPEGRNKICLFDTQTPGLFIERRANGTGTFYYRYTDARGRLRYVRLGRLGSLAIPDARKAAQQTQARIAFGGDPAQEREQLKTVPSFAEFVQEHYIPYVRSYKSSWHTDQLLLRRHVLPRFGRQPIDRIRRYDVHQLIQELRPHYKPATVNRVLILVRYIFNLALKWGMPGLRENPTHGLDLLKENNKRERFLSPEEVRQLFAHLESKKNPWLRHIIAMLVFTGARRGEVLQARWADIEPERQVWRIPQPKATERRHVPLSDAVVRLLEELGTWRYSEWLFPNPRTGRPFGSIYTSWNRARRDAGLPEVRLHDLRHSFASYLVNQGHSLYEVQKLLGHTQIQTTQRYAHLSQERLREASNNVGELLKASEP